MIPQRSYQFKTQISRMQNMATKKQIVIFEDDDPINTAVEETTVAQSQFLAWFATNKNCTEARSLTYVEFPSKFVWKKVIRKWEPRKKGCRPIGRIFFVPPGSGELYYLRILLNLVKGPLCYEDIRTVDNIVYPTFRDACYARGLLDDDKEYIDAIEEASHWGSGQYLRQLFASLLFTNSMTRPEFVWQKKWEILSDGILHKQRNLLNHQDLQLSDEELSNLTLIEIEKLLLRNGKSLKDFDVMPFPDMSSVADTQCCYRNKLIQDEFRYDRRKLTDQHTLHCSKLNPEQKDVYNRIMSAVDSRKGGVFFVWGYGGTGKTFVWNTLSAALRSKGNIVLTVASSGIASLLLPGGRTAHSRFAIPLNIDEFSTCNIKQGTHLAELIIKTKLIIWDEAPMMNKYCFEALDRTMRDLLRFENGDANNLPFGGKTIVFGGDFRQILPVIKKGSRQDIVNATINSSYLWDSCQILKLTQNMRIQPNAQDSSTEYLKQFTDWILNIGDGKVGEPNDGFDKVCIPEDLLIHDCDDPIDAIVRATYCDYIDSALDDSHLQGRAILAPTLSLVDEINDYMLSLNSNDAITYLSSDAPCISDTSNEFFGSIHTPEFLNSIKCSGLPNHDLILKIGTPIMLIRNIDHSAGLCNGTRLVISRLGKHIIEAKVITGNNVGEKVFIPRMTLTPSDTKLPFQFQRRQFPIMVSYAMTINKSQGQSLHNVGLILKKPVFTHGQLYVAISRVTNPKGLKILICHDDYDKPNETTNVVYKEVFRNV